MADHVLTHALDMLLQSTLFERGPELGVRSFSSRIQVGCGTDAGSPSALQLAVSATIELTSERTFKALRVLGNDRNSRAKVVKADLRNIHSVNRDCATLSLDDTIKNLHRATNQSIFVSNTE